MNTFYAADTFRAEWSLSKLGALYGADYGPDFWASAERIEVEIFAGFPADSEDYTASDLQSQFFGRVDDLSIDWASRTLEISGRDLTGDLIDAKTSEKYPNLTSSQIAEKIAAKYGLIPIVTATTTKAGRFYQIDHVRLKDDQTEWDLLSYLARDEGFVVYVTGRELHFEPRPGPSQDPYIFQYTPPADDAPAQANASVITTSRNLTLAKDIKVSVHSWAPKSKKSFTKTFQFKRVRNAVVGKAGRPSTPAQEYSYTIPNLTPEQALQRAEQIARDITRHEVKLSVQGPADNILTGRDVIQLAGTGTAVDQVFFPDSIVRGMSSEGGYAWRIEGKNHSPETEPSL